MKKLIINSRYCRYNKATFLLSTYALKSYLIGDFKLKKQKYALIHIKIMHENYDSSKKIPVIKVITLFLKSQFRKNDIITKFRKNEFLIMMRDVKSAEIVEKKLESIQNQAESFFKFIGFYEYFYMVNTASYFNSTFEEIDVFCEDILSGNTDNYITKTIDILKSIPISNQFPSKKKIQEKTFLKLLSKYFSKKEFFDFLLNILSSSHDINELIIKTIDLFQSNLDVESIYFFIKTDDSSFFINKSHSINNNNNNNITTSLKSISFPSIVKFSTNHDYKGIWMCNNFKTFPSNIKSHFKKKEIKSICNHLLRDDNSILGFIGFQSKHKNRFWSEDDISALMSLGRVLSVIIKSKHLMDTSEKTDVLSKYILDSLSTLVYSIDDKFNLTYTNETFKKVTGYKGVRNKCYEVLMNSEYPCSFCPIKYYIKNKNCCQYNYYQKSYYRAKTIDSCYREIYYKSLDRYFKVYITKNENNAEHKYLINAFDIDQCKKFSSTDFTEKKEELFKNVNFGVTELYNAISRSSDSHIIFYDMRYDNMHIPEKFIYELGHTNVYNSYKLNQVYEFIYKKDIEIFSYYMNELKMGTINSCDFSFRALQKNGEPVWVKLKASTSHDLVYSPTIATGIITFLNSKNLMNYATNLPNKYYLKYTIEENLRGANTPTAIILMEIDNLNQLKKIFGRQLADLSFVEIISLIKKHMSDNMMLFLFTWNCLAIKVDTDDVEECIGFFNKIKNILSTHRVVRDKNYYLTISAGCALYPDDAQTYQALINDAEYALESAKQSEKQKVVFFNKHILSLKYRKNKLSQIIGDSVSNHFSGFHIVYQPHICTKTENLLGAEALSRFTCEEFDSVPPDEFIGILEELGLIQDFGKWVITKSVKDCYELQKTFPNFHININVSYLQLLEEDFVDFLKQTLEVYTLTKKTLFIELTETSIVKNRYDLIRKFKELRDIGIKIAMDDFGTGYSSLGLLKDMPLDMVKIDKIFVKGITSNEFDATFIQFISILCKKAKIETCLEGVEVQKELDYVKANSDIDMIQGFFYGKPQKFEDFKKHIQKWIK